MIAKLMAEMFKDISVNLGRTLMKDKNINRYLSAALAPVLTTLVEGIIMGLTPKDMDKSLKSKKSKDPWYDVEPGEEKVTKKSSRLAMNDDWEPFFREATLNLEENYDA